MKKIIFIIILIGLLLGCGVKSSDELTSQYAAYIPINNAVVLEDLGNGWLVLEIKSGRATGIYLYSTDDNRAGLTKITND